MDEEKQDASYFNFGGFSHDDMHPTLDRHGSVPNTKSIKVSSQDNIIGILREKLGFRITKGTLGSVLSRRRVSPTPR